MLASHRGLAHALPVAGSPAGRAGSPLARPEEEGLQLAHGGHQPCAPGAGALGGHDQALDEDREGQWRAPALGHGGDAVAVHHLEDRHPDVGRGRQQRELAGRRAIAYVKNPAKGEPSRRPLGGLAAGLHHGQEGVEASLRQHLAGPLLPSPEDGAGGMVGAAAEVAGLQPALRDAGDQTGVGDPLSGGAAGSGGPAAEEVWAGVVVEVCHHHLDGRPA